MFKSRLVILVLAMCCFVTAAMAGDRKKIKIASGSILEGYYSISLSLCRYISEANPGVDCEVIPTVSSMQNIDLLRREVVDFAIVQSNIALDASKASGYFIDYKPMSSMYQLLNLHEEIFTVMVRDESNILVFKDLEGKKISNGPPGSDSTISYKALEAFYDFEKYPVDIELSHEDYAKELCGKGVDAIMMMTGHPSALVSFIANNCNTEFVSLDESKVDELIQNNPFFNKKVLAAGFYPGVDHDQHTISIPAIFVGMGRVDPVIVANLEKALSNNINDLKLSHPTLYDLEDKHFTNNFILPKFSNIKVNSN
jgi:hypothetical protein